MNFEQYQQLRQNVGTQETVASQLGVNRVTLARRENGALPINREAALAMSHLQPFTARPMLYASEAGKPFTGRYGIFLGEEGSSKDCAVVVAVGLLLLASDAGRDNFLNRILANDLRGIRLDFIRFVFVPTSDESDPRGFEFKVIPDLKDFAKKGGALHRPKNAILTKRTAHSSDLRAGSCSCRTDHSHDSMRHLSVNETLKALQLAGL